MRLARIAAVGSLMASTSIDHIDVEVIR